MSFRAAEARAEAERRVAAKHERMWDTEGEHLSHSWGEGFQAGFREAAEWADCNPPAVAALRAVTDLHQPRSKVTQSASGHLVDTPGPCTACDRDWPCPTITAITDAIGGQP